MLLTTGALADKEAQTQLLKGIGAFGYPQWRWEYPYVFSEESGAGLCYDSMSGAWCLAAAAYHAVLTGDRRHIQQWLDSEAHYHSAYIVPMVCYGGPLDIDMQVDSEGGAGLYTGAALAP